MSDFLPIGLQDQLRHCKSEVRKQKQQVIEKIPPNK